VDTREANSLQSQARQFGAPTKILFTAKFMTIVVSILVPDGIALAADSRQVTISPSGQMRVDSDNTEKIYQLDSHLATAVVGQSTFYLNQTESPHSIGELLCHFSKELPKNYTIHKAANFLNQKMKAIFMKHVRTTKMRQGGMSFYLAGYNPGKHTGELYCCNVLGGVTLERTTNDAGAVWSGDREIINRLILGYDPELLHLFKGEEAERIKRKLQEVQLYVNFQTMPLQDAINLAVLLVRNTIEFQSFSDGLVGALGHFPTCGGAVDVAMITGMDGFNWLRHKQIVVREEERKEDATNRNLNKQP
jgi:20S proteasome alpha/beta subunit